MKKFFRMTLINLVVTSLFLGGLFGNIAIALPLPDLIVQSVTFSKNNPTVNETITVTATVKNIGTVPAGNFMVLVISEGGDKAGGIVSGLAPGSSTVLNMPGSWQHPGTKDVTTMADTDGYTSAITESDENNNVFVNQITVVGQGNTPIPNPGQSILSTLLSLKASPKIIKAGKVATITGKLKDNSGKPVAGKQVKIKANGKVVKTVTTNAGGSFSFKHKPKKTTIYQAFFNGDSGYSSTSSNKSKISVKKPKKKKKKK